MIQKIVYNTAYLCLDISIFFEKMHRRLWAISNRMKLDSKDAK